MTSMGNDIIALDSINALRTKEVQFYSKIISVEEKELYKGAFFLAMPFEHFVWLAWSIKESVYKFLKRNDPSLLFSPLRISILELSCPEKAGRAIFGKGQLEMCSFSGIPCYLSKVRSGAHILYCRSLVYQELICTVAADLASFDRVYWGIRYIKSAMAENQSREVRAFILALLAQILPSGELIIAKSIARVPLLLNNGKELSIPISLSHHGPYVAYSFYIDN